jgi:hypothetical protein
VIRSTPGKTETFESQLMVEDPGLEPYGMRNASRAGAKRTAVVVRNTSQTPDALKKVSSLYHARAYVSSLHSSGSRDPRSGLRGTAGRSPLAEMNRAGVRGTL